MNKAAKRKRVKYYVEKHSFGVSAAVVCMLLSAIFRLIGCWGLWGNAFFAAGQIVLPIVCCLVYALCIRFIGGRMLSVSLVPVILCTVFFIIKAADLVWWQMLIFILIYLLAAAVYTGTVLGYFTSRWPAAAGFALPLAIHLVFDFMRLSNIENPVSLHDGLQEISLLFILAGLFFALTAFKKRKPIEEAELPKMKAPRVIKPEEKKKAEEEKTAGDESASASGKGSDTKAGEIIP